MERGLGSRRKGGGVGEEERGGVEGYEGKERWG